MIGGAGSMPFTRILIAISIVILVGACALISKTAVLRNLVYNYEYRAVDCLIAGGGEYLSVERMPILLLEDEYPSYPLMLLTLQISWSLSTYSLNRRRYYG